MLVFPQKTPREHSLDTNLVKVYYQQLAEKDLVLPVIFRKSSNTRKNAMVIVPSILYYSGVVQM